MRTKFGFTLVFAAFSAAVSAQNTGSTFCQSAGSDNDGDGWGWENGVSCRVEAANTGNQNSGACIDPDGDG